MTPRLLILILLTQLAIATACNSSTDMELEFERVCFEIGGTMDTDGYCDMENADVRLLRDLNISKGV